MNDYDDSEDYSSANSFRARSNTWPLNRPDITIPSGICIDEALPEIELEDDDLFTTNENWSSGLDHDIMSWDPFLNAQNHETHQHNNISTNTSNHHHNNNHHQHHSLSILDPAAPLPSTDPTALYQQQNFHNNMPYTELQVFNPHLEYISAPQQAQIEAQVPANSYSSASAIVPPISQIEAEQQQQQQQQQQHQQQQQQQQHLQQSIHETLHETLHEPVHESVHEHYNEVSVMSQHHHHQDQQQPIHLSHDMTSTYAPAHTDVPSCPSPLHLVSNQSNSTTSSKTKLNTPRRNAWGNMSYADLISQAINSTNDKRLTLSQIYDWMVQHVPYFKDKGDSNSSAGWKNSVRHNLSLHNRFKRLQNEGTGKSSWWTINPEANIGKCARRRAASMEASKYEKKRGRAKKRAEAIRQGLAVYPSLTSSSLNDSALALDQSPTDSFSAQQSQSEPQQQPSRQKLSQTQRHLHTDADGLSSNNLQNGQPDATGLYVTSQHDSQYESTDNIMQQQQQQSPYFMPFTLNV